MNTLSTLNNQIAGQLEGLFTLKIWFKDYDEFTAKRLKNGGNPPLNYKSEKVKFYSQNGKHWLSYFKDVELTESEMSEILAFEVVKDKKFNTDILEVNCGMHYDEFFNKFYNCKS